MTNTVKLNELLSSREAAELLGIKPATLDIWRSQGKGPKYLKFGHAVRYAIDDVEAYIEAHQSPDEPVDPALSAKLSLSIEEAAKLSSIGRSNLFKAIREKKLTARKLGRRTIILQTDLQAFLHALPVAGAV